MKLVLITICVITSIASFAQTKYSFDNEKIEKLIERCERNDYAIFYRPSIYKISYEYDSLFIGSWSSPKDKVMRMWSSVACGYHYLSFDETGKFYTISGSFPSPFSSSGMGRGRTTVFCGTFHFDALNGLLYMKWEKCEDTSKISSKSLLFGTNISTPDINKKSAEKVYKVIYITRELKGEKLKGDSLVSIPLDNSIFSEKELLLVECEKATWKTPVENIIKQWNKTEIGKMPYMIYVR